MKRRAWLYFVLSACGLLLAAWTSAAAAVEGRVALVIGNGAYAGVSKLTNPPNDARDVAAALRRLRFDVTLVEDLDASGMRRQLQEFEEKTIGAEIAIVYYAGHGIEVGGANYLIPVDAQLRRDIHVEDEGIPLTRVMAAVEPATRLRLVILDACRNNPFAERMRSLGRLTRSVGRGLAPVEDVGSTVVAYAAKDGTTAADGAGRNSPYTRALLDVMEEPGLEVGLLFRRVHDQVLKATGGVQQPFVYGALSSDPIFLSPTPAAAVLEAAPPAQVQQPPPPQEVGPPAAYLAAQQIGTPEAWDAFLKYCSDSVYCDLARAARARLEQPQISRLEVPQAPPLQILKPPAEKSEAPPAEGPGDGDAAGERIAAVPPPTEDTTDQGRAAAADCDRLAADPADPDRPAALEGIEFDRIAGDAALTAVRACGDTAEARPNDRRLLYQFGRALHASGEFTEAEEIYRRSADLGSTAAMVGLGVLLAEGRGATRDIGGARAWFEKASAAGDPAANNQLALLLYADKSGDQSQALTFLREAADAGDAAAMANLALLHHFGGSGVAKDFAEARRWYEKAADAGSTVALVGLGSLYRDGQGVPRDFDQARTLFERAADRGHPGAMNNLGTLYEEGNGVAKDDAKAREWYERGAAAGSGMARHNLAILYASGRGGPRDLARAATLIVEAVTQRNPVTLSDLADNPRRYDRAIRVAVQRFLIEQGQLEGSADGSIGPKTRAALSAWAQQAQ